MKYSVYYSLLLFLMSAGWLPLAAQSDSLIQLRSIKVTGTLVESDNVGNIFVIRKGRISMFDKSGDSLLENSSMALGTITSMDATNALKMPVFFNDLSQVVYLDNKLAQRAQTLQLDLAGYPQTTCICTSYNDGLWLFDQVSYQLVRLDENFNETTRSGNLIQLIGHVPEPNYMREFNNWLYLNDSKEGILVFDWYGTFNEIVPIKGIKKFVIRSERLYYIKEDKLQYYDLKRKTYAKLSLPVSGIVDFTLSGKHLYLLLQNQLVIYELNMP